MKYCLACNKYFEDDVLLRCPHCGTVGDDIEELDFDNNDEYTDKQIEEMYQQYLIDIGNAIALIGAQ